MIGKDIDQFLEGSDFDLDEYDGMSQSSHGTGSNSMSNIKLKAMESAYLRTVARTPVQAPV